MEEKQLCKCGCKIEVTWNRQRDEWNTFLKGHCNKGKKGSIPWNKGKIGLQKAWNKGLTKKTDIRVYLNSNSKIGKHSKKQSKGSNDKRRNSLLKWYEDPKNKSKHIESLNTPGAKKKNSDSHIKYFSIPENKEKFLQSQKFRPELMKKLWKDPEYIKKVQDSRHLYPNKPETIIINILNELFPNEWKYTGDFSFMINGKNPDFTNINGQKKLIEFFGDYWHKGGENEEKERKEIFKEFGYETLIIREYELKNINQVKLKLEEFNKEEK